MNSYLAVVSRVLLAVAGLAVGAVWWLLDVAPSGFSTFDILWFAIAAVAVERLVMRQPGGLPVPASLAVLGAAAILGASPAVVSGLAAVAWLAGRLMGGEQPGPIGLLGRVIGVWSLTGFAGLGTALLPYVWVGAGSDVAASLPVGAALAVGFGLVIGVPAAETLARSEGRRHWLRRVRQAILATWLVAPAVAATATLGALVHPVLGAWSLPIMLVPLLAARFGLEQLFVADRAYEQTIRAMSRLPEWFDEGPVGPVPEGHGVRVGELAREVALELGLSEKNVTEVVRAAHLHELGRIDLDVDAPVTRRHLADAGGRVVRQVSSHLEGVAAIVETYGDLSRSTNLEEEDVLVAARIVAACCELDLYSPDPIEPGQRDEVVVRLVRDVGDLAVVSALMRVLDRRLVAT